VLPVIVLLSSSSRRTGSGRWPVARGLQIGGVSDTRRVVANPLDALRTEQHLHEVDGLRLVGAQASHKVAEDDAIV
jgi:hypothetical protein